MAKCDLCSSWKAQRVGDRVLCPRCQKIDADARWAEAQR